MPALPRSPSPTWRAVAGAWLVMATLGTVHASPAGSDEPLDRLLAERQLVPSPAGSRDEPSLARSVRDKAAEMVMTAMNFIGVPYRRGGDSIEEGFDCSGFTRHVFEASLGLVLPRRSDEQARAAGLQAVRRNDLQPGDLVFFNTLRRTFSHVGIYIGDDKFIHSPRSGAQVRIEDMGLPYWTRRYNGARRAPALEAEDQGTRAVAATNSPATSTRATRAAAEPRPSARRTVASPAAHGTTAPVTYDEQWGALPGAARR